MVKAMTKVTTSTIKWKPGTWYSSHKVALVIQPSTARPKVIIRPSTIHRKVRVIYSFRDSTWPWV